MLKNIHFSGVTSLPTRDVNCWKASKRSGVTER